jgi:hypothetical protein
MNMAEPTGGVLDLNASVKDALSPFADGYTKSAQMRSQS